MRDEQPANALLPKVFNSGRLMLSSEAQPKKAKSPASVAAAADTMTRLTQFINA